MPPFKANDDFKEHMSAVNVEYDHGETKEGTTSAKKIMTHGSVQMMEPFTHLLSYIEPQVQDFFADTKKITANDITEMCEMSKDMIDRIADIISDMITNTLQYDGSFVGTVVKMLLTNCRGDKVYEIVKHILKIIPSSIMNCFMDPLPLKKWVEDTVLGMSEFIEYQPKRFIETAKNTFDELDLSFLDSINDFVDGMGIGFIKEQLADLTKTRVKDMCTMVVDITYLLLPMLIIFANVNSRCDVLESRKIKEEEREEEQAREALEHVDVEITVKEGTRWKKAVNPKVDNGSEKTPTEKDIEAENAQKEKYRIYLLNKKKQFMFGANTNVIFMSLMNEGAKKQVSKNKSKSNSNSNSKSNSNSNSKSNSNSNSNSKK